jgi:hypothetical protein
MTSTNCPLIVKLLTNTSAFRIALENESRQISLWNAFPLKALSPVIVKNL